jgi:hypothetical protein
MARDQISSVVDENVQPAECSVRLSHKALDYAALGYVALKQDGSATCLLDVARHMSGFVLPCSIVDGDVAATAPERTGNRRADAAAGACDQASLLLEVHWKHHLGSSDHRHRSASGQQKWKGDGVKCGRLLELWRVTRVFDHFETGARDPIAHFSAVFRRPSPIMPALDDQRRNGN